MAIPPSPRTQIHTEETKVARAGDLAIIPMEIDSSFRKVAGTLDLNKSKICAHCHTTKTSLWRNGPLGHKSLCNACGIRYQRRGMKALELESKDNKGKKKKGRSPKGFRNQKRVMKALKLGSNGEKVEKKKKNKTSKKVELEMVMMRVGCWKDPVLPQSQHGDEVEKAAMQLMYLSGATQYLIKNK